METHGTETVEPLPPDDGEDHLPRGTVLSGRFEILEPLGRGGYATVYRATDHQLNRSVAVKVLRGDRVTPTTVARMRREVVVARDVTSPRLVRLFDLGQDGPITFISMELVEGESLRQRIVRGPLGLDEALDIAEQILEALSTLHAAGIIHRDLKPANILLTPAGGVKLADFGLARHWENEDMRVTRTEALVGTIEYLSPEQALGRELDPRSDLYAFGVVLFEMLTGELPFGGASSLGTVVAHVTTHAPDVRKVRAELPVWLSLVIRRLLEKQRDRRHASADEVRRSLSERKIDWSYRWRRSRTRTMAIVLLLALTAVGASAGWVHYWSRFDSISSDATDTLSAYDRSGRVLWSHPNMQVGRRAAVVNVRPGERRVFAVPLDDPNVPDAGTDSRPLHSLDLQTGEDLGTVPLPAAPSVFPAERAFNLTSILPVDVDHDGTDEVLLSYIHFYWPSYTLLVDPRTGRSGTMFLASGHHRPLGAIDIDGDGVDEVLFSGPNNRMGWRNGVAAVRAKLITDGEARVISANTPDAVYDDHATGLVWYALLSRQRVYISRLVNVDEANRTFDLERDDGSRITLTFDGFVAGSGPPGEAPARTAARSKAYSLFRESLLKESLGNLDAAIELAEQARTSASDAGDKELADWLSTLKARMIARTDRDSATVDAAIEASLAQTDGGPELCWEVARAFSQRGEARRAADWFERALTLTPREWSGHPPADYLTEAVISLVEIEQWDEANELIDRFISGHPEGHAEALRARELVFWRTGRQTTESLPFTAGLHPLHRYWSLEHEWATKRPDPIEFLNRIRTDLADVGSVPWIRSLEADVLFRLGRIDEALPIVRQAWDAVTTDSTDSTARIHRAIVKQRLDAIEAAARR